MRAVEDMWNIKCLEETPLLTQKKKNLCLQPLLNNSEMEMEKAACYKDCLGRLRSFKAITLRPEKQQGTFLAHILSTHSPNQLLLREYRDAVTQVKGPEATRWFLTGQILDFGLLYLNTKC